MLSPIYEGLTFPHSTKVCVGNAEYYSSVFVALTDYFFFAGTVGREIPIA